MGQHLPHCQPQCGAQPIVPQLRGQSAGNLGSEVGHGNHVRREVPERDLQTHEDCRGVAITQEETVRLCCHRLNGIGSVGRVVGAVGRVAVGEPVCAERGRPSWDELQEIRHFGMPPVGQGG